MEQQIVKSSYILRLFNGEYSPFRPTHLVITEQFIEKRKRNWHLINVDTQTFHFQNVIGMDVNKHIFSASITISTTGTDKIIVRGFSKNSAKKVKELCGEYISKNTQRGTTEALADAIATAVGNTKGNGKVSVADELKKMKGLLDSGIITQSEYDEQKAILLKS